MAVEGRRGMGALLLRRPILPAAWRSHPWQHDEAGRRQSQAVVLLVADATLEPHPPTAPVRQRRPFPPSRLGLRDAHRRHAHPLARSWPGRLVHCARHVPRRVLGAPISGVLAGRMWLRPRGCPTRPQWLIGPLSSQAGLSPSSRRRHDTRSSTNNPLPILPLVMVADLV